MQRYSLGQNYRLMYLSGHSKSYQAWVGWLDDSPSVTNSGIENYYDVLMLKLLQEQWVLL